MRAEFTASAIDGGARSGTVRVPGGTFRTPCFMPVGTRGAVRHLSSVDLAELGAEVVLGNTYHLMLRPGAEVIRARRGTGRLRRLGGAHPHRLRWLPDLLAEAEGR